MRTVAIGTDENPVQLWCKIGQITDGRIYFYVINGAWNGRLDGGMLGVRSRSGRYKDTSPAKITWQGDCPFPEQECNHAMEWIRQQIEDRDAAGIIRIREGKGKTDAGSR